MKKVIIIGAGELGSRHLQGLMASSVNLDIICIDLFEPALLKTKKRLEEITHPLQHKVSFSNEYSDLPDAAELAIISTNSLERLEVIEILLSKVKIRYLVLEKVLFPKIEDYLMVQNLVNTRDIKVWVNCPRRLNPSYQLIRNGLQSNQEVITMTVKGNSWNLGSNAIHFIDLFTWFTGNVSIDVDTSLLDREIFPSKRNGYFEFSGTLVISDELGNKCHLHSYNGEPDNIEVAIKSKTERILVKENEYMERSTGGNVSHREAHVMKYQSQLSNIIADDLLKEGNISLTPLHESIQIHLPLIKSLMNYFDAVTGRHHSICPIT